VFIVYRQPIALDRFAVHDVRPSDTSGEPPSSIIVVVVVVTAAF